ncbi:MAG: type II toxin-antitoxin system PemK/MazF family toxin [Bacteroidota bacterium]
MPNEMTGLVKPLLRGDVYEVNLDPVVGKEIGKKRPAVVIQNNTGNEHSALTIIAPISSIKQGFKLYPVMVVMRKGEGGLKEDSFAHCGQIRSLDKELRLVNKLGHLTPSRMAELDVALKISLSLN